MTKRQPLSRISITIPSDLLEAADRLAEQLDRSRSWVLSEGIRRMSGSSGPASVRDPVVSPYAGQEAEMEAARLRRLRTDLALTPAERLQQAEDIAQLGRMVHPPRNRSQVIGFDTYEDYDRWKTTRRAGG